MCELTDDDDVGLNDLGCQADLLRTNCKELMDVATRFIHSDGRGFTDIGLGSHLLRRGLMASCDLSP